MKANAGRYLFFGILFVVSSSQVACNASGFGSGLRFGKSAPVLKDSPDSNQAARSLEDLLDETVLDAFNRNDEYVQRHLGDDVFTIKGVEFSGLASFYDLYRDAVENSPSAELTLRETLEEAEVDIEALEMPKTKSEQVETLENLNTAIENFRELGSNLAFRLQTGVRPPKDRDLVKFPEEPAERAKRVEATQPAAQFNAETTSFCQEEGKATACEATAGAVQAATSVSTDQTATAQASADSSAGDAPANSNPGEVSVAAEPASSSTYYNFGWISFVFTWF